MQIILPIALIWINKKVSLGEYVAEIISHLRIKKRKKDLITNKKGCLIYKIKFTNGNEYNANQN